MTDESIADTDNFEVVTEEAVGVEQESTDVQATTQKTDVSAAPEETSKEETNDDDAPKGKGRFQKRIDRLTKRVSEAERRAEEAERKLKDTSNAKANEDEGGEPDPSDYTSYDEYLEELSNWKDDRKNAAKKPEDKEPADDNANSTEAEDTELAEAIEDAQDAFDRARKIHADFDEVISQKDLKITRFMAIAMADSDEAGAIAYHLGKNPDEAERISKLSTLAQAKEIGKLEVLAANAKKPPTKRTTSAPDPIEPIKGGDTTRKGMADMDFAEYERTRNEKERKSGRGFW